MPSTLSSAIIHGLLSSSDALQQIERALRLGAVIDVTETTACARPCTVAALWQAHGAQFLVWCATPEAADRFANDAAFYLSDVGSPVYGLRSRDAATAPPNPSERSDRLVFLERLQSGSAGIYCVSHAAARQPLPQPQLFAQSRRRLQAGQDYAWDGIIAALAELGYERVDVVSAVGEYAVRGGLIDVFPATGDYPVRLEFFGDRLEQIRRFALNTQRSLGDMAEVHIGAWSEFLTDNSGATIFQYAPQAALFVEDAEAIVAVDHGLSVLQDDSTVAAVDAAAEAEDSDASTASANAHAGADAARATTNPAAATGSATATYAEPTALSLEQLKSAAGNRSSVNFISGTGQVRLGPPPDLSLALPADPAPSFGRSIERFVEYARLQLGRKAALAIISVGHRRIREVLEEHDLVCSPVPSALGLPPESSLIMCGDGNIDCGFVLPRLGFAVICDNELYGHPARRQKIKAAKEGTPLRESDLKPGEYFVHAHHGIGQYLGLEHLAVTGVERDFMHLKYAGQDRLYVPIDQMHLVRKYTASDGVAPRLSKMGGSDWARSRSRVREAVEKIADGLVRLYAARELTVGHAFSPDTPWQAELEESFPYDETPDQHEAIAAVKADMERSRPMDRLICGDVGYGKTEVAIRAAFKAIMDRKQVAVLAPTTVLAAQHFRTFSERNAAFPVRIALLSRFRSKAEQKETLQQLQGGSLDLVIGTHRLLQKDVGFKQLGLIVIDEEQRFGVMHKERLKEMRQSVDVLTLSATPIPRTLHMAMAGVRELSLIQTAPNNRVAIKTVIAPSSDSLIAAALNSELDRGGQVYFVHNRIETIYGVAAAVQKLAPRARIAVGHGQLQEKELERVMLSFVNGEIDVLISTTIIENGLDIPNVNTILVNNAAHFGLAQLYQLRGRVGRSAHQAYAYFLYQPHRALSEVAQSRLQAIREFSHLGSGLQLAMRDLEIRGAGNLLGREQHGFIAAVGFETYCNILQEAVAARRGEILAQPEVPPILDIRVSAYLSSEYVRAANQKVSFYQRLAAAQLVEEVDRIAEELRDRFGPPPKEADALLELTRLRVLASAKGVQKVALEQRRLTLDMGPKFSLSEKALPSLTSIAGGNFRFTQGAIVVGLPSDGTPTARLATVRELMQAL